MSFRISGLDPAPFWHLYGLSDVELAEAGAERHHASAGSGLPDRVGLRELGAGESALLLNYVHQPADTPYRASHAIFVHEGAEEAFTAVDIIPQSLRVRPVSLRAFTDGGTLIDADLAEGDGIEPVIERLLALPDTAYLHAHYAKHGCYAARIERA